MTPVLLLIVVGIIEFSFMMRNQVVVVSDARVGARIASAGAGSGGGTCRTGPDEPPCTTESSPALAQAAADAIQRSGSAMPMENINYVLIYRANSAGYPGIEGTTTMPTSCAGIAACVRFEWRGGEFRYSEGAWDSRSISACFPGTAAKPLERVGVYLNTTHTTFTGLFTKEITLDDRAVMNFEPLPTASCGSMEHT